MVQDPVPHMAKFWFLYARPGNKVLLYKDGDMIVCPTPLDVRLQSYKRGNVCIHCLCFEAVLLKFVCLGSWVCEGAVVAFLFFWSVLRIL